MNNNSAKDALREFFSIEPFQKQISEILTEIDKLPPVKNPSPVKQPIDDNTFLTNSFLIYEQTASYDNCPMILKTSNSSNNSRVKIFGFVNRIKYCYVCLKFVSNTNVIFTKKVSILFVKGASACSVDFNTPSITGLYKVYIVIEFDDDYREILMNSILFDKDDIKILNEIKVNESFFLTKKVYKNHK